MTHAMIVVSLVTAVGLVSAASLFWRLRDDVAAVTLLTVLMLSSTAAWCVATAELAESWRSHAAEQAGGAR